MGKDIEHNVADRTDSVGPQKEVSTRDADEALRFLRSNDETAVFDDVSEKKLMRKVDWMLMPLMFVSCSGLETPALGPKTCPLSYETAVTGVLVGVGPLPTVYCICSA